MFPAIPAIPAFPAVTLIGKAAGEESAETVSPMDQRRLEPLIRAQVLQPLNVQVKECQKEITRAAAAQS